MGEREESMTRAEIMALRPGPETDALVAKAMGLCVHEYTIVERGEYGRSDVWQCAKCGDRCWPSAGEVLQPYSTDIRAAFEMEERLSEHKRQAYAHAIDDVLYEPGIRGSEAIWRWVHASPLDRVKAFLIVMEDAE